MDIGAHESDATQALGDFDGNQDLNLADLSGFQLCMYPLISNPTWLDACLCTFDYDENLQIDLDDFAVFHNTFVSH